jgi:hypothetical protein
VAGASIAARAGAVQYPAAAPHELPINAAIRNFFSTASPGEIDGGTIRACGGDENRLCTFS